MRRLLLLLLPTFALMALPAAASAERHIKVEIEITQTSEGTAEQERFVFHSVPEYTFAGLVEGACVFVAPEPPAPGEPCPEKGVVYNQGVRVVLRNEEHKEEIIHPRLGTIVIRIDGDNFAEPREVEPRWFAEIWPLENEATLREEASFIPPIKTTVTAFEKEEIPLKVIYNDNKPGSEWLPAERQVAIPVKTKCCGI